MRRILPLLGCLLAGSVLASPLQLNVSVENRGGLLLYVASIKNTGDDDIYLLSYREVRQSVFLNYRETDTYWGNTIQSYSNLQPVCLGQAAIPGAAPLPLTSLPRGDLQDAFQLFTQESPNYSLSNLSPGKTHKLAFRPEPKIPKAPSAVSLAFLVYDRDTKEFRTETVEWKTK